MKRHVVGITGASGSIIGVRLTEELLSRGEEVTSIVTGAGWKTLAHELFPGEDRPAGMKEVLVRRGYDVPDERLVEHDIDEFFASPASGSSFFETVTIAPASMKSVAALAHGLAENLLIRAADVALKEGRTLVLVPRETPVTAIHLDNMKRCAEAGAAIVLPVPGFYTHPAGVDDIVNFIVGRILSRLGYRHDLVPEW